VLFKLAAPVISAVPVTSRFPESSTFEALIFVTFSCDGRDRVASPLTAFVTVI